MTFNLVEPDQDPMDPAQGITTAVLLVLGLGLTLGAAYLVYIWTLVN